MSGVVTLGETMAVVAATDVGPLRHASAMRLGLGGAESNLAIGVQRLGVPATWIGRVGDDEFGRLVARELQAEGVTAHAIVDEAAPTGLMVKEQRTTTTTRVSYYRSGSAGSRLEPADLDPAWFTEADVLHVTGITLALSESARQAVTQAIKIANDAGASVSLDVNHRSKLWGEAAARSALAVIMPYVDILFVSDDEARLVVADSDAPLEALAALGPAEVLLKHGAEGAEALIEGQRFDAAPLRVPAIDPVGAGDAFAAGYLAARIRGQGAAERLATANAAGAFAVTARGDWEGAVSWRELELLRAPAGHVER